jgi:hypothetical protein
MNNKTGRSPYEIRLELLQLAFDVLVKKHEAAAAIDTSDHRGIVVKTSPSAEDIIAEAEKMNTFVSRTLS